MTKEDIVNLVNDILNRNLNNKLSLELCVGISYQVKTILEQNWKDDGDK